MSPKLNLSMFVFAPLYLFRVLFFNTNLNNTSFIVKIASFAYLISVWTILICQPGNILVNMFSANIGVTSLVLFNVYSHVDDIKSLLKDEPESLHIGYNLIVSSGCVSVMMLIAYIPKYISHYYTAFNVATCNIGIINITLMIMTLNLFFVLFCREVLIKLPKNANENYLSKIDLSSSSNVCINYLAMIIFLFVFMRNAEFKSTMCQLLIPLIP